MRTFICRWLMRCFELHMPGWFRYLELRILMGTAADAFGISRRRIRAGLRRGKFSDFAAFTAAASRHRADPARLYLAAFLLGRKVRRITGFTDAEDLRRLVFLLYRGIGISMEGTLPGCITVTECAFSSFYAPAQCRLMSAMDSGVIAGLFGGGKLVFSRRITEGCPCCRACFQGKEQ